MKKYFEKNSELFLLYAPLLYGIGIGLFLFFDVDVNLYWLFGGLLLMLVAIALLRKSVFSIPIILISIAWLGYANITTHSEMAPSPLYKTYYALEIEGVIEEIELFPRAQRILLDDVMVVGKKLDNIPNKVRIKINGLKDDLSVGDMIKLKATLLPPPVPAYPNKYDYSTKAWFEGVGAVGYSVGKIEVLSNDRNVSMFESIRIFMANVRQDTSLAIREVLPYNQSRVALALVTGEQTSIDNKILQNYRDTGLAHILSVSGMHMSMLAFLIFAVCRTLLSMFPKLAIHADIKKISAAVAILVAAFYLMISGGAIPAQRAFIMVFVALGAILINRRAISLRSLAIAAILVLTVTPEAIISPGFQMSFAAVTMLIAFHEKFYIKKGKAIKSYVLMYVYAIVITAIIGTLATAPYVMYHFNRFPLYGVFANLCVSTLFSVLILPFLLIAVIMMPFGLEKYPLMAAGKGIEWMNEIAALFASLPHSVILVEQISFWSLMAFTVGVYFFILSRLKRKYLYLLLTLPMFVGFFTYTKPDFIVNEKLSLAAVNNDGTLILTTGMGDRRDRDVWLSVNGQEYNKAARYSSKEYFKNACDENNFCIINIKNFRFEFSIDRDEENKSLKIYKNGLLFRTVTQKDLKANKTMVFYVEGDKLFVDTLANNKTRWWK